MPPERVLLIEELIELTLAPLVLTDLQLTLEVGVQSTSCRLSACLTLVALLWQLGLGLLQVPPKVLHCLLLAIQLRSVQEVLVLQLLELVLGVVTLLGQLAHDVLGSFGLPPNRLYPLGRREGVVPLLLQGGQSLSGRDELLGVLPLERVPLHLLPRCVQREGRSSTSWS